MLHIRFHSERVILCFSLSLSLSSSAQTKTLAITPIIIISSSTIIIMPTNRRKYPHNNGKVCLAFPLAAAKPLVSP